MRFIKKFENFSKDGLDVDQQTFPTHNQASNLKAEQYVEEIFAQGAGEHVKQLCKEVGVEMPKDDEELELAKQTAIEYFKENPERIKDIGVSFKTYPHQGGDRISRVQNIGGTRNESIIPDMRPSKNGEGCVKANLTKDDMRMFKTESSLMKLLNNNKVSLHEGEVWYYEDDPQTKKILDVFFEI